ncbi:MAG: CoA ester lyase [Pseudomonadota bacterium]
MVHLRRTLLYVPADNERALAKATQRGADGIIVDLEDAVAPDRKAEARQAAVAFLASADPSTTLTVRVNAAGTPWHDDDLAAVTSLPLAGVVLPKVRTGADVTAAHAGVGLPVWPMMETARAILNAAEIADAAAATGSAALVMGTNDLALEIRAPMGKDRAALGHALQQCVLAARAAGIDVLDGVMNTITDMPALVAETYDGLNLGMTGKTVIHPCQVGPVNRIYTPTQGAVTRARETVAALKKAESEGRAVATLKGQLIERLHVEAAERTLALSEAISEREGA